MPQKSDTRNLNNTRLRTKLHTYTLQFTHQKYTLNTQIKIQSPAIIFLKKNMHKMEKAYGSIKTVIFELFNGDYLMIKASNSTGLNSIVSEIKNN